METRFLLANLLWIVEERPETRDLLAIVVEPLAATLDNRQEVLAVLRQAAITNPSPEARIGAMRCPGSLRPPSTPS